MPRQDTARHQDGSIGRDGVRHDADRETVRDMVAELMPWLATVLLHAGVVMVAILFVWATLDRKPVEENLVPVIGYPPKNDRPLALKPITDAQQKARTEKDRSVSAPAQDNNHRSLNQPVDMAVIQTIGHGHRASPFGEAATGQQDDGIFTTSQDGLSARSFVFVIDASGSMIDTLPFVVAELKRTIRSLREDHTVAVLFFQGDQILTMPGGLQSATAGHKKALYDWLDGETLAPSGLTDPIKAIEQGLSLKPQVMYLLSDNITGRGWYEINQKGLLDRIARANTAKTKINTIQFLYPDPLSRIPGMKPTLQMISEQSGGRYRFLSAKDLGL